MRPDSFISKIFLPLSWLYGLGVWIRNILYDEHILPTFTVKTPTICVGNIAVGGTGKTPHVEYLINLLTQHGYQVAVLSRGYKRQTKGFLLADADATAATIGDEPMLLHTKYPNVPIAVCKRRVHGIHELERRCKGLQAIILDDAFQYRRLRCGYNLLLTAYDNLYVDDHMLPAGRLRDTCNQVIRANAVVITKCPKKMSPIERRIVGNKLKLASFQRLFFSHMESEELPLTGIPLLVTGIAHPESMLQAFQNKWPRAELMAYSDHHQFSNKDIEQITERAQNYSHVVTTEKDYVRLKLKQLPEELSKKLIAQSYHMVIDDEQEILDKEILQYVRENNRMTNRHE